MDDDPQRRADHATVGSMDDDPQRRAEAVPAATRSGVGSPDDVTKGGPPRRGAPSDIGDAGSRSSSGEHETTSVGAALRDTEKRLAAAGIEGARFESTLLLGHVLGLTRAQLIASLSDPLSGDQARELAALAARRAAREPLQYLRGLAPFLDFELEVHPGVFIPRPETEQLVDKALELWDPAAGRWAVDVGTGSGAIAIGLARARPEGRVLAIDRNPIALTTARRNAERLGVADRISFVRGDLLASLCSSRFDREKQEAAVAVAPSRSPRAVSPDQASVAETTVAPAEAIGIIVANPPYVVAGDEVDPEVRDHEPHEAWAAGPTGLEAYERIIPAAVLLPPGRWLVLELGYGQQGAVSALLADCGDWDEPTLVPDFHGIPRVLAARRAGRVGPHLP
jgi:release factor glutamine methyltransferase